MQFYINAPTSGVVSKMKQKQWCGIQTWRNHLRDTAIQSTFGILCRATGTICGRSKLRTAVSHHFIDLIQEIKTVESSGVRNFSRCYISKEKQPHYQVIVKFSNIETIDKESLKPGVTGQASIILGNRL